MKIIGKELNCKSRSSTFKLYPLGDIHIGAMNCAENEFRSVVRMIRDDPDAMWVGGGDMLDAVVLQDVKRFDIQSMPAWMFTGKAEDIKAKIGDIISAQQKRFLEIVWPIKDKCLGLIEGNHEYSIYKHHGRDVMTHLCEALHTENLTDCAFIRMRFRRGGEHSTASCSGATVFICHGFGEGRSAGAEPNKLAKLAADKEVDLLVTGHSHNFHIMPPVPMLWIPTAGKLPEDTFVREKHVANWGSYMYTYKRGPSTYASRANYPVRPMYTVQVVFSPFKRISGVRSIYQENTRIAINQIRL